MDSAVIQQCMELFRSQGPVFWAAVVAITSGLTLLSVTIFIFLKGRFRSRRDSASQTDVVRNLVDNEAKTLPYPAPSKVIAGFGSDAVSLGVNKDNQASAALLARLRATGSRLEALQEALRAGIESSSESQLKPDPQAVEYVFRQGVG